MIAMPRKWRVEWTDGNHKNWITRRPLGQREAAEKVRRLMRKTRSSGKHAVLIRCFPYVYATDPSLT